LGSPIHAEPQENHFCSAYSNEIGRHLIWTDCFGSRERTSRKRLHDGFA
jgi:hypothetical protein